MLEISIILLIGIFVGVVSSLLGLGGGILIAPLLPTLSQLTPKEAIATSLLTIFLVVANNCRGFQKKRVIHWRLALIIGPLTAIGSYLSGHLAQHFSDFSLRTILAVLMLVILARALMSPNNARDSSFSLRKEGDLSVREWGMACVIGLLGGLLSGISGVGAGIVISPLLINLHLVENQKVAPTANAVMLFTTFFGALAYISLDDAMVGFRFGYLHLDKAFILFIAAFASSHFIRGIQHKMPQKWRLWLLTTLLTLLTLKMWAEIYLRWQGGD